MVVSVDVDTPAPLYQLLANPLILSQTVPYLSISSLFALGLTSKSFQDLIYHTPHVFRHVDLTKVKSVQFEVEAIDHGGEIWRNVQLDENVTEDDFYAGPLRGSFSNMLRRHILQDVQTLVLDGLSVTAELIGQIILENGFNIRLLSVREVKHLNERKLMQILEYAVRPSRPASTPRLQGLYIFGPKVSLSTQSRRRPTRYSAGGNTANGPHSSTDSASRGAGAGAQIGAQWNERSENALSQAAIWDGDDWFKGSGKMIPRPMTMGWAETIKSCSGLIHFDAVLCNGPRHSIPHPYDPDQPPKAWYKRHENYIPPMVATHSLGGCAICGTSPEGWSTFGISPIEAFPLLSPVPIHSSSVKAAMKPSFVSDEVPRFLARCPLCLRNRYCENCHKWWCEDCYEIQNESGPATLIDVTGNIAELPGDEGRREHRTAHNSRKIGVSRDCWECGLNCAECITRTQQRCKVCGGGYCIIHNEGSTITTAGRHAIYGCRWCAKSRRRTRELY